MKGRDEARSISLPARVKGVLFTTARSEANSVHLLNTGERKGLTLRFCEGEQFLAYTKAKEGYPERLSGSE